MTQNDIITLPNPHLRQRSKRIAVITDDTAKLVNDMIDALLDWEDSREHEVAVALAAVQVDRLERVVVVRNDFDNKDDKRFVTLINPEITKYEGQLTEDFEGCLSIRDLYGKVPRHSKVRVKALDLQGREFRVTAEGFLARILQHEIDHTKGTVFVDHIKDHKDAFYCLTEKGDLEKLNYDKDIKNSFLWQ